MDAGGFYAVGVLAPDRRAIVAPDGTEHSYGDLLVRVNRLSNGMAAAGLAHGDPLAVVVGNRVETLEIYAAAIQLGLDVVVVNWHLTAPEVEYILVNSNAAALVVEPTYAPIAALAADGAGLAPDRRFVVGQAPGFTSLVALGEEQLDSVPSDRHAGQALFYTSGTTGRPKAVRKKLTDLPPGQISLSAGIGLRRDPAITIDTSWSGLPEASREVHLVAGPLYHAAPLAYACGALDQGSTLVLMERFDPVGFLDRIGRYRVTNAGMVPIMFHRLLALPASVRQRTDVSSLAAITHAGAPCPIDVKQAMIDWWGPIITEGYSSTEGAGTTITSQEWLARPGSVGQASPGVTLRILDDEGSECVPGTPGRVFLTQAYWEFEYEGDPAKTAAARHGDMFTVGDIGYVDEAGYLFLCDRDSEVINSGGVNIYPAEIEGVLLSHPAVIDGVIIGVPDDEWGEAVRAVVQTDAGDDPGDDLAASIIEHCRDRLAHYKAPKRVDFVADLGRDLNGKVRKQIIRDRYWGDRERRI